MKLTTFTDFGLRALILLADRKGEILSAAAIADHFHVSRHHMAKVLQELASTGYLEGIRGAQGGVRLARIHATFGSATLSAASTRSRPSWIVCARGGTTRVFAAVPPQGDAGPRATGFLARTRSLHYQRLS